MTDVDINRMLRCSKCGEWKPDEEFHRDRSRTYRRGRRTRCRLCQKAASAKHYAENRERYAEHYKRYYAESRERLAEYRKRYRTENADAIRERNRRYRLNNPTKSREWSRRYRASNPERRAESSRRYKESIGTSGLTKQREGHLRALYRLDPHEYVRMCERGCHRCGATGPGCSSFHVDHDHSCCTGEKSCGKCVRGILCLKCNTQIGHIERLRETPGAVIPDAYLDRWEREGQWWKDQA